MCLSFLISFAQEIKGFYQSSFKNEADFMKIMSISPNILARTEAWFCRWKSNNYSNINIFKALKSPDTFLLVKEKTWKCVENTNSELLQNCTEKQIMSFKTTVYWLFIDIQFHLVIDCFDWNIVVFQQL